MMSGTSTYRVFTLCNVRNKSASFSTTQLWDFCLPSESLLRSTGVQMVPKRIKLKFPGQPQDEVDSTTIPGICPHTVMTKKVYQRLYQKK
jgi:hypothetical protein